MLVDTHTHLCDPAFDADRGDVLARAFAAGIERIVEIGDSPDEWPAAAALRAAYPGRVFRSLGLHPYYADRWTESLEERLEAAAREPGVVAVGEVGLDYARCEIPHEAQKESLRRMLRAAKRLGLPAVIHCREAYDDIIPMLEEEYKEPPSRRFHGVLHCFAGNTEHAVAAARLGFALGVDGPVTYPKNEGLRAALRSAGLEVLVLETDCPYLPPQSRRGKRNEPSGVLEIAEGLARAFGTTKEKVAGATTVNARDLLGLGLPLSSEG